MTKTKVLSVLSLLLFICVTSFSKEDKETVKLLFLVPWPDEFGRDYAGWDGGYDLIAGARVAQDDINNRTDLLADYTIQLIEAGHEACGLTENSLGLRNLVSHAASVAAVLGLFCSTNTRQLSPLASHENIGLIQLSASNSPLFRSYFMMYPHQWRFLVSASVYADMMLHLMEEFDWKKIAVIQDVESYYYSGIATYLLKELSDTQIIYSGDLYKLEDELYKDTLEKIQSKGAKIIFVSANGNQISKLLCMAGEKGLIYPNYVWIVTDLSLSNLLWYNS